MRFSFSRRFLQNFANLILSAGVVALAFFFRESIEALVSPQRFFWVSVLAVGVVATLLFLLSIIGSRVTALADSRTQELLETQKLFVELYRNSPVPYVMIDSRGVVTYPNTAALRLFGIKEEEQFAGQNIFDRIEVLEDEQTAHAALVAEKFKSGVFVEATDVIVRRPDTSTRYGLLSIFTYGSGSGRKGLVTIVDITKQKNVEQAKSEFVSLASHQLRTPISTMRWNLELLASPQFGELSSEQQQYYDKVMRATGKMNDLIEDFLNVSQLELGTKEVQIEEVGLAEFVNDIAAEFEGRVAQKQLKLEVIADERIATIENDKRLLHMVISNLTSNATKYTPENGTVRVQYTGSGDQVTFTVADSGVGIPIDDQEQLFSKFFRASNVRDAKVQGTGLGLYIVKLAVEKMGGTIAVQSVEGEGTVFTVVLPRSVHGRML